MFLQIIFKSLKVFFLLLVSATFFVACDEKAGERHTKEEIQELISKIFKNKSELDLEGKAERISVIMDQKITNGFNGNVLIAQKGQILYEKSVGFANFEDSIINKSNSQFQLASLSKTFTAVAVMQLVEKGLLSLDLSVKDYYPEFPYEGITVRSLLSHRSGLPHYEYNFDKLVRSQKLYPNNQELMQMWATADPMPTITNKPDHFFAYNNSNFAILAALVEKVSKERFSDYMHKSVLEPLEMNNTFFANEITDTTRSESVTFGYERNRRISKDFYDNILGDKGVFSTTHDLLKWYKMLRDGSLISKESLRELFTPRSFEHPGLRNYGYGFRLWLNDKQQTDYIYHTGWWKGYNTIMFFDPREEFVIIIVSNRLNRNIYQLREIINVLHGGGLNSTMEDSILDS